MNNGGEILFSVPISVKNKKEMIDEGQQAS